jgi:hypothetical protein
VVGEVTLVLNSKLSQTKWLMPVILTTQEKEVEKIGSKPVLGRRME